jgi:hypothetical protein
VTSVQDLYSQNDVEWLSIRINGLMFPKLLKPLMMPKFSSVCFLDLSKISGLCDNEIRYLVNLANLKYLDLSYSNVTTKGLKYLLKYSKLNNTLKALKLASTL